MSGFGMDEDVRLSREAGFRAHMVKPINLSELRQTIRRLLAGASGGAYGARTRNLCRDRAAL